MCCVLFDPLKTAITKKLWPSLFEDTVAEELLPARLGGFGISDPVNQALESFTISRSCSEKIISAIRGTSQCLMWSHLDHMHKVHTAFSNNSQQLHDPETLKSALDLLDHSMSTSCRVSLY